MTSFSSLELLLPWLIGAPAAAALTALLLPSRARNLAALVAVSACLLVFGLAARATSALEAGQVLRLALDWSPSLGLQFVLRLDGLAWLFVLLVSAIGALVALYARGYMPADAPTPRFFGFLLGFTASMLGVVTAGDIVQLVVFWELTSLFSFLLIGFWYGKEKSRNAARTALLTTALGGLFLLGGALMLGHIVGSYDLDDILRAGPQVVSHPLMAWALVPILIGAFTKSAQVPFHVWLPQAMAAPTPVSAYLHSATLVKAGVFLLARLWPVFSEAQLWLWLVGGAGMATLLYGGWRALFQDDLKGLLAYSTLSHLGLITFLLGLGAPLAAFAAIFHIVNHAMFKAALFMSAGAIEHETGSRSLSELGGLVRPMPLMALLTALAAAAMAGVPLLSGFISKEMFFAEVAGLEPGWPRLALIASATLAGALGVAYAVRLWFGAFAGQETPVSARAHEPTGLLWAPIAILAGGSLAVGLAPALLMGRVLELGAGAFLSQDAPKLALWHGLNLPLGMTMVSIALGAVIWWVLGRTKTPAGADRAEPWLNGLRRGLADAPAWLEGRLGPARLQRHLFMVFAVVLLAMCLILPRSSWILSPARQPVDAAFAGLWAAGCLCALGAAVFARSRRVTAIVLTGGAGLATAVTFTWFSSPDLAITQLLVEIITTILLLLGLRWLPEQDRERQGARSGRPARIRDALLAAPLGLGLGALAYGVMTYPTPQAVSRYYLENAYSGAGGRNAVNVILVDFRGFDTLGEITVVAIVALAVVALLRGFQPPSESVRLSGAAHVDAPAPNRKYMLIPGLIIQLMFPMIVLFGLHLFLRGHDLPGGGFAGGVAIAAAILLLYMAMGVRRVEAKLRIAPGGWMALGLLIATLTGVGAMVAGRPFMTSAFTYLQVGGLPPLPLASALVFDLGVLLLVVGASAVMLVAIAHQSHRRPSVPPPEESS